MTSTATILAIFMMAGFAFVVAVLSTLVIVGILISLRLDRKKEAKKEREEFKRYLNMIANLRPI
jgi:Na+-transporting methylmalonyl-CoA/oxaloacetate decarboxylase gamma subunit